MYINRIKKFVIGTISVMVIYCIVMYLNNIGVQEILYGMVLAVFSFLVLILIDYSDYRRKYRELCKIEGRLRVGSNQLPEAQDAIEKKYSDIIEELSIRMMEEINAQTLNNKDMQEYYSIWVHQIKTPISALKLLLQDMDNDTREEERVLFEIEEYVEMALSYMRIKSDSTDYVLVRQEVDGIIRDTIRKYTKIFIHRKIKLKYDGIDERAVTDRKWLGFVIGQILSNALKYTKPGGSVYIYMEGKSLVIEDTGIGIAKEDIPRVFEKGYTGYNGHEHKHSSGIGLYLCKVILTRLSHDISIESEPGVGTKVKVDLVTDGEEI